MSVTTRTSLRRCLAIALAAALASIAPAQAPSAPAAPPAPPAPLEVSAQDAGLDRGGVVVVRWVAPSAAAESGITGYVVARTLSEKEVKAKRSADRGKIFLETYARLTGEGVAPEQARVQARAEADRVAPVLAAGAPLPTLWMDVKETTAAASRDQSFEVSGLDPDEPYRFSVAAVTAGGAGPPVLAPGEARGDKDYFFWQRRYLLAWILAISGAVIAFILAARAGMPMRIRRIAALEAVDEAVGRATEMGRSVLFIPGIQDMDNVQTIAGITILSRVAKTVAEYDATIEVPTARSLAMQASKEAVQASYMQAGRSESFNPDLVSYITDEQFGFVAYVAGRMVREKPAACFYMGCFFAESLILAETGNSIGAIQIAGTAESSQLPFFVAACDYTLIGEEFFAASAYLSGEPDQIGSIKGQDVGKVLALLVIVFGAMFGIIAVANPEAGAELKGWLRAILTS